MTTDTETDWPYDADRDDPLASQRIPVVGSSHPRWYYIVAFDSGRIDAGFDGKPLQRPTDLETRQLVSFLEEYISHWYNETWKTKMRERPFDIDGGANGTIFRKWGENDWAYRKRTWEYGPLYVPQSPALRERYPSEAPLGPLSLVQVMDRIHTIGNDKPMPRWLEWKASHPDVFGEES